MLKTFLLNQIKILKFSIIHDLTNLTIYSSDLILKKLPLSFK